MPKLIDMSRPTHARSILEMVGGCLAFATMAACVKAARRLPFMEIVFFRSLFGLLGVLPFLLASRSPAFGGKGKMEWLLFLRGGAGFLALVCNFYAITHLPLAMSAILTHTGPVFVVLLARAFLKEHIPAGRLVLVATAFSGVALLLAAGRGVSAEIPVRLLPCLAAVLSGFLAAVAMVSIRAVGEEESPYTIILHFVGISTLLSLPFLLLVYTPPSRTEWLILAAMGVFSCAGQIGVTLAYQRTDASLVTSLSYTTPVYSYVLGYLLWRETLTAQGLAGGALVVLASILIARQIRVLEP